MAADRPQQVRMKLLPEAAEHKELRRVASQSDLTHANGHAEAENVSDEQLDEQIARQEGRSELAPTRSG